MKTKEIEDIVRKAFKKGESWGVTYSGWFSPTEIDTENKIQEAINEIVGDEVLDD